MPPYVLPHSKVSIVAGCSTLSDDVPVVVDATHGSITIGQEVFAGRHVAAIAHGASDLADIVCEALSAQPPGSTRFYLLAGSDISDMLIHNILRTMCRGHPETHCHVFASHAQQLSCETITHEDFLEDMPPILGVAYTTLAFGDNRRAVLVGAARISITMIALLQVSAGAHSVVLSIGASLSSMEAIHLIQEFEAISELLRNVDDDDNSGDSRNQARESPERPPLQQPEAVDVAQRLREQVDELQALLASANEQLHAERQSHAALVSQLAVERSTSSNAQQQQLVRNEDIDRLAHERDRLVRDKEALATQLATQYKQVEQLHASNRNMEARILLHQQERDDFEQERHALQRNLDAADMRVANMASAMEAAKEGSQQQLKALQRELMQTVVDFQRREKQWQAELVDAYRGLEAATAEAQQLQGVVRNQTRAIDDAVQAAALTNTTRDHELDDLLSKVKAMSPLGKLQAYAATNHTSNAWHTSLASTSPPQRGVARGAHALGYQRDDSSRSPYRGIRYGSGGASVASSHLLVSPMPGERVVDL